MKVVSSSRTDLIALERLPHCLRICSERFFSIFKKRDFYSLKNDVSKSGKKSLAKFSHQSVKMSSYTSPSDHCNSTPSSRSVVHSKPLLNVKVCWNFGLKIHGRYGDSYRRLSHTVLSCSFLCPLFLSKTCYVGTFWHRLSVIHWVVKAEWLSGFWNYTCVLTLFFRIKKPQKTSWLLTFCFELLHTYSRTLLHLSLFLSVRLISWLKTFYRIYFLVSLYVLVLFLSVRLPWQLQQRGTVYRQPSSQRPNRSLPSKKRT